MVYEIGGRPCRYPVERGVPIPDRGYPRPGSGEKAGQPRPRYPWQTLELGESFFVPLAKTSTLSSQAYRHPQLGFTFRKAVKDGIKGVRCWRIR